MTSATGGFDHQRRRHGELHVCALFGGGCKAWYGVERRQRLTRTMHSLYFAAIARLSVERKFCPNQRPCEGLLEQEDPCFCTPSFLEPVVEAQRSQPRWMV